MPFPPSALARMIRCPADPGGDRSRASRRPPQRRATRVGGRRSVPVGSRAALVLLGLSIGAVALSRLTGILIDASANGILLGALATEIALTAIAFVALRRLPKVSLAGSAA